jgi:hypothetical protein
MSKINLILSKLDRVKKISQDEWVASSPTRSDRSPSLYIKETPEGKILLHDFGGSTAEQICDAIGMDVSDLFAETYDRQSTKYRFNAHNILTAMRTEVLIVSLSALDLSRNKKLKQVDLDRLLLAAQRLKEVYELCLD